MSVAYSVSSVTVKDGVTSANFTVKRSGTSSELASATSVDYATEDITAIAGTDYTATSGSLSFAADVTEASVTVAILSEGYAESSTRIFLLALDGYGSATGSIVPSSTSSTTQTYLYLPEDDDSVTVPTATSPGDNLKYQALYSGFSDPADTSVEMPLAYVRLGYAGTDMNEYERVILNADSYHPGWRGTEADGTPIEKGANVNVALPRAIDRRDGNKSSEEENNAHLDGLLLYSNANYSLSVAKQYSQVVKGDYISSVEGEGRLTWYARKADWVFDTGETSFMTANGATVINGQKTNYNITSIRRFDVAAEEQVNYAFGARYVVNADTEMTLSNSAKYAVNNGIKLDIGGLEINGECDIYGNYALNYPGGEQLSTKTMFHQAASGTICLSIQTGYSSGWTTAVQVAAALNAAAAVGIATGSAYETFGGADFDFYDMATPDNLDSSYATPFSTVLPDLSATLAVATAALLVTACVLQQIAEAVAVTFPKIEMTAAGMTLSCGATSQIAITAAGVAITTPTLSAITTTTEITAPLLTVTGTLGVTEAVLVEADLSVVGVIDGTLVEAG